MWSVSLKNGYYHAMTDPYWSWLILIEPDQSWPILVNPDRFWSILIDPYRFWHRRSGSWSILTVRTCERWFGYFREGDRSLQNLPRTERPQILDLQSVNAAVGADSGVTSWELVIECGCCQRTIINALHYIVKVCKRLVDSFQTDRKPQDPENGHLSVNALYGQECELFRLNFNWRQKVDRVR